jgi:hypothetical protein
MFGVNRHFFLKAKQQKLSPQIYVQQICQDLKSVTYAEFQFQFILPQKIGIKYVVTRSTVHSV